MSKASPFIGAPKVDILLLDAPVLLTPVVAATTTICNTKTVSAHTIHSGFECCRLGNSIRSVMEQIDDDAGDIGDAAIIKIFGIQYCMLRLGVELIAVLLYAHAW